MMTIKEFYEWAVKNGIENAHFGISTSVYSEEHDEQFDYCEPVNEDEPTIGALWDPEKGKIVEEPFVWLNGVDTY